MNKSHLSNFSRRLVIVVWAFSIVSAALWLWIVIGQPIDEDMTWINAAIASGSFAGLAALLHGILVVAVRTPLSPKIVSTFVAGLAVCAWTGYVLCLIDRAYSGTWPY